MDTLALHANVPTKVNRIIKEERLEPDLVKGGCAYYGEAKVEIIKRKLKG